MSDNEQPYNQTMVNAWTGVSVLIGATVLVCFICGHTFLETGRWIWDLLRWICSPII